MMSAEIIPFAAQARHVDRVMSEALDLAAAMTNPGDCEGGGRGVVADSDHEEGSVMDSTTVDPFAEVARDMIVEDELTGRVAEKLVEITAAGMRARCLTETVLEGAVTKLYNNPRLGEAIAQAIARLMLMDEVTTGLVEYALRNAYDADREARGKKRYVPAGFWR